MEQEYDVIVLGTGLKECILSGLMSTAQKKVLHMDRNSYYGGESASLNLEQLWARFKPGQEVPKDLGRTRDYNVDLCPKFLMACGNLVKVLLHTKVTRYLEFKSIAGGYVYRDGKIFKVPATAKEALNSDLMGLFQKRRFKNFLQWASEWDKDDAKTHQGCDLNKQSTKEIFEYWKLDEHTQQFTGHAIALHPTEDYFKAPARYTIEKIKLYAYSIARYGNSPFIYPVWGLGGLPEGFSRLCAIYGGVYMLNKPIKSILYHDDGKVKGVVDLEGKEAYCKQLICDPSYLEGTDKIIKTNQIIRCICILSHPVPDTNNADSCQIIMPFNQLKRKNDIYISVVSYHHKIAANGKYIAVVSTNMESKDAESEIKPALDLLGKIDHQFLWVSDHYVAATDGTKDQIFVTSSYDATSHFESATDEVINMYERITGSKLDLTISAEPDDLKEQ